MKILALQLEKSSGCALMIDDQIVYAASEERFTRIKSDSSFPKQSIQKALEISGISAKALDQVLICSKEVTLYAALVNLYSSSTPLDFLVNRKYFSLPMINTRNIKIINLI